MCPKVHRSVGNTFTKCQDGYNLLVKLKGSFLLYNTFGNLQLITFVH